MRSSGTKPVSRSGREILEDILWALEWAKWLALFYALIAVALYLFVFRQPQSKSPPLLGVIVFYFAVAALSAIIVGYFRPFADRGPRHAALVGALAACPVYSGAVLLVMQNKELMPEPLAGFGAVIILAPLIGGTIGYRWFNMHH